MPKYIAATAIPQSLLECEAYIKSAVRCARSERGDSQARVIEVDNMFAEVHEVLDGLVTMPSDLMGLPQVLEFTGATQDLAKVVSIQVQTTRLTGGGVCVVPMDDNSATHWSVYLRKLCGQAEWVCDFTIEPKSAGKAYSAAIHAAAKLSMEHQVPLEKIH